MAWDEEALIAEVNTRKSEEVVKALARKYNVRDKNGNGQEWQYCKEWGANC